MEDFVTMTHSLMKGTTIEVARSAVPFHMASGWMPEDKKVAAAEKDNVPPAMAAEAAKINKES